MTRKHARWRNGSSRNCPLLCRAWLKEENGERDRENADEGIDNGVQFDSSAQVHARGEWGHDLSMMATWWQASIQVGHVQVLQAR
jgi:hypothetical protein